MDKFESVYDSLIAKLRSRSVQTPEEKELQEVVDQQQRNFSETLCSLDHANPITGKELRTALESLDLLRSAELAHYMKVVSSHITEICEELKSLKDG